MAASKIRRLVIAGGSFAGYSAVSELLDLDHRGELVWVTGRERSAYSKPALSKEFLQGRFGISDIVLPEIASDRSNVRILRGRICTALKAVDRRVQLDDGAWLPFDGMVVCTGATARLPAWAAHVAGVRVLRTLEDALAIRAEIPRAPRTAILGGGLVGCELAASLRTLGLEVTLIERLDSLLGRSFGEPLADYFLELHRRHGVRVIIGASVEELVARDGRVAEAHLSDGTVVATDLVLVGAGADPTTRWLEGSGLALSDGVVCDANLAASQDGIYAAGDVARWFNPLYLMHMRVEHWMNAGAQGRVAARNLLASDEAVATAPAAFADVPYFWSDQYGHKIQMVGWHHDHDRAVVEYPGQSSDPLVTFFAKGRLVAAVGVNAPRAVMSCRRQIEAEARACAGARTCG
jgi:3-phenylpropionate/trans-cinnamate dioxygenase ferredoxin reductase component